MTHAVPPSDQDQHNTSITSGSSDVRTSSEDEAEQSNLSCDTYLHVVSNEYMSKSELLHSARAVCTCTSTCTMHNALYVLVQYIHVLALCTWTGTTCVCTYIGTIFIVSVSVDVEADDIPHILVQSTSSGTEIRQKWGTGEGLQLDTADQVHYVFDDTCDPV